MNFAIGGEPFLYIAPYVGGSVNRGIECTGQEESLINCTRQISAHRYCGEY